MLTTTADNLALIKRPMRRSRLLMAIAIPGMAWASPRTACVASSFVGKEVLSDGRLRASTSASDARIAQFNECVLKVGPLIGGDAGIGSDRVANRVIGNLFSGYLFLVALFQNICQLTEQFR